MGRARADCESRAQCQPEVERCVPVTSSLKPDVAAASGHRPAASDTELALITTTSPSSAGLRRLGIESAPTPLETHARLIKRKSARRSGIISSVRCDPDLALAVEPTLRAVVYSLGIGRTGEACELQPERRTRSLLPAMSGAAQASAAEAGRSHLEPVLSLPALSMPFLGLRLGRQPHHPRSDTLCAGILGATVGQTPLCALQARDLRELPIVRCRARDGTAPRRFRASASANAASAD